MTEAPTTDQRRRLRAVKDDELPAESQAVPEHADSAEATAPQPVDQPDAAQPPARDSTWNPVVPGWMRSRADAASAVAFHAARARHRVCYHGLRIPAYAFKLAARSPRGALAVAGMVHQWCSDAESTPLRMDAVARGDAREYMRLLDRRDARVRARLRLATPPVAAAVTALVVVYVLAGLPGAIVLLSGGVLALGAVGGKENKPLAEGAVVRNEVPMLTSKSITTALTSLGIGELNKAIKDGNGIRFVAPIKQDGPGWRADIDLPPGVIAAHIMDKRSELASGLRRPVGAVWPEPDHEQHAGRLVLWVGHQDMNKTRQPAWPLAKAPRFSLFNPVPFGTDQRARPVEIPLMYTNLLVGSLPGAGKSMAVRESLVAAALDPTAEIRAFELKGTGDLSPLEPIAHHYGSGADDETAEACLQSLRQVHKDLERRAKTISKLPRKVCPENKVTPDLAARKDLGLHPLVFAIDECFPAGTTVGGVPIEKLQPGDPVPSWDEASGQSCTARVRKVFTSEPTSLVRVRWSDGNALVCTPNHPLMTRHGWASAGTLTAESEVLRYGQASRSGDRFMLSLPESVRAPNIQAGVLEEDWASDLLAGVFGVREGSGWAKGRTFAGRPSAAVGAYASGQPVESTRGASEDHGCTTWGPQDHPSGWQWAWPHVAPDAIGESTWLGHGGHRPNGPTHAWWSTDALQAGYCRSAGKSSDRGRRELTPGGAPRGGRAQGRVASWRRVDRVEVLQPGSDGRYGGLCPDGVVYNLEVEGTHTYQVADGIVAHNCQELFAHSEYGKEAASLAIAIIKRGRALGVILLLATQRPDKDSLPTGVSANVGVRFCLRVMGQTENDMVLGTSMYKNGVRATTFTIKDLGIGYLVGAGPDPQLARTYYMDANQAEKIVARARAAREAAGTLSGHALTGDSEKPVSHLDNIRTVFFSDDRLWLSTIAERLAEYKPQVYNDWTAEMVGSVLFESDIESRQINATVDGRKVNRRGILRAQIDPGRGVSDGR